MTGSKNEMIETGLPLTSPSPRIRALATAAQNGTGCRIGGSWADSTHFAVGVGLSHRFVPMMIAEERREIV